ncbi:MAG: hypothetical protein J1E62_01135 [Lachnospiraceae bacterium]|nr:hypothetical protein [Lachnospiraceae bacterium]
MRYYHYGTDAVKLPLESKGMVWSDNGNKKIWDDKDLIIEEDTIYEIDRECINCKKGLHGNCEAP